MSKVLKTYFLELLYWSDVSDKLEPSRATWPYGFISHHYVEWNGDLRDFGSARSALFTITSRGLISWVFPYIPDMRDEFRSEPVDTDAILNEDVVLECNPPKGHPEPVVKWKKDGDNLDLTSSKRIKIDERGNLVRDHFSSKGRKINFWCIVQSLKFWKLLRNCNLFCKSILCQYFTLVCC